MEFSQFEVVYKCRFTGNDVGIAQVCVHLASCNSHAAMDGFEHSKAGMCIVHCADQVGVTCLV